MTAFVNTPIMYGSCPASSLSPAIHGLAPAESTARQIASLNPFRHRINAVAVGKVQRAQEGHDVRYRGRLGVVQEVVEGFCRPKVGVREVDVEAIAGVLECAELAVAVPLSGRHRDVGHS